MKQLTLWDPFPRRNLVIFFSLFLFFSILFLGVFFTISYDSDHASLLLEAKDILDGNIFLKGWDLSSVTFMTTEIPITIAGILIFGYSENVIYFVSAVTYAALIVLLVYYCSVTRSGKVRFDRAVISGSLSILLMSLASVWGLLAPVHIVGFIYCLLLLLILRHAEDRFQLGHAIIFGLLSLLLYFGDTFFIYNFALPLVVAAGFNLFFGREIKKNSNPDRGDFALDPFSLFIDQPDRKPGWFPSSRH